MYVVHSGNATKIKSTNDKYPCILKTSLDKQQKIKIYHHKPF